MIELVQRLRSEGPDLSRAVLEAMYRDPFWTARFGDRGRRFADEDSDYHLRYLTRAVIAGDAKVMARYAVWLREVLATRGMCTRHLAENFLRLEEALLARGWPDAPLAAGYLEQACLALRYDHGPAAEVQALESAAISQGEYAEDPAVFLSYLADALALGNPATFIAHVKWTADWFASRGRQPAEVRARLEGIARLLREHRVSAIARLYVDEARAAIP